MSQMTEEEYRRFLGAGTRTAKLATTLSDGRAHVVPVWFLLDHEDLVFTTGKNSAKGRSVLRSGHVAICVDDERPPYAFVAVDGRASIKDDPSELLSWTTRIAARYVGQERADYYGKRNAGSDQMVVRVMPTRVVSENNVMGE